jgi:hypothetical protein
MNIKKVIKLIEPYCTRIVDGKHIKAYTNTNKLIVISKTSSDRYFHTQVFRDFRRAGIIINELNKNN